MATRSGPRIAIRFETRKDVDKLKRAAKILGQSFNTFVNRQMVSIADDVIRRNAQPEASQGDAIAV